MQRAQALLQLPFPLLSGGVDDGLGVRTPRPVLPFHRFAQGRQLSREIPFRPQEIFQPAFQAAQARVLAFEAPQQLIVAPLQHLPRRRGFPQLPEGIGMALEPDRHLPRPPEREGGQRQGHQGGAGRAFGHLHP